MWACSDERNLCNVRFLGFYVMNLLCDSLQLFSNIIFTWRLAIDTKAKVRLERDNFDSLRHRECNNVETKTKVPISSCSLFVGSRESNPGSETPEEALATKRKP